MSNVCQWCSNTSSTIDSMEYQIEQLQRERDALKAKCEILREALWGVLSLGIITNDGYFATNKEETLKGEAALAMVPKTCLAEIERAAIYLAVEHIVRGLFTKRNVKEFSPVELRSFIDNQLCNYADELRQQAGEQK